MASRNNSRRNNSRRSNSSRTNSSVTNSSSSPSTTVRSSRETLTHLLVNFEIDSLFDETRSGKAASLRELIRLLTRVRQCLSTSSAAQITTHWTPQLGSLLSLLHNNIPDASLQLTRELIDFLSILLAVFPTTTLLGNPEHKGALHKLFGALLKKYTVNTEGDIVFPHHLEALFLLEHLAPYQPFILTLFIDIAHENLPIEKPESSLERGNLAMGSWSSESGLKLLTKYLLMMAAQMALFTASQEPLDEATLWILFWRIVVILELYFGQTANPKMAQLTSDSSLFSAINQVVDSVLVKVVQQFGKKVVWTQLREGTFKRRPKEGLQSSLESFVVYWRLKIIVVPELLELPDVN